jgi:hypothetical protein
MMLQHYENCKGKWCFDIINLRPDCVILFENTNDAILFQVLMDFYIKNKLMLCYLD